MKCLKYSNFITLFRQFTCTGDSSWSGSDHSYLLTVLLNVIFHLFFVCHVIISNKTFQTSDTNRFSLYTTNTLSFTLLFLWADTSTNGRQCIFSGDNLICSLKIPFCHFSDKFRNRYIYRTT